MESQVRNAEHGLQGNESNNVNITQTYTYVYAYIMKVPSVFSAFRNGMNFRSGEGGSQRQRPQERAKFFSTFRRTGGAVELLGALPSTVAP